MAENNWVLNDSAPTSLAQEFAAAPTEGAWGWFGLPAAGEGTEFAAPAAHWAEQDWLAALGYQMAAEAGGTPADIIFGFFDEVETDFIEEVDESYLGFVFDEPANEPIFGFSADEDFEDTVDPDEAGYDSIAIAALEEQPVAVVSEWIIRSRRRGRH